MNLKQIEAIENNLIRNVLATCWNVADAMDGWEVYGCDLHHKLFNSDHYTTWIPQTEADTDDLGVWDCIKLVHTYEKWNFGEVSTEMSAFKVANMVNYILGDHLLGKSEHLKNEAWDEYLTADDLAIIQKELRAYIEGLTDWRQFWDEVCREYKD